MQSSVLMTSNRSEIPIEPTLEALGLDTSAGVGRKLICIFHDESNPSAVFYPTFFKCFACGVQGDAPRLLHDFEGLDWKDAYQRAKDLAGIEDDAVSKQRHPGSRVFGGPRDLSGHNRFGQTRRSR